MGSEDLFKKRKARKNNELKRVVKSRHQMKKILIVCEGEKTEPAYFTDLVNHCRITTASIIEITGDCGSSPTSIVKYAKARYEKEKKRSDAYDKVYCVFDKDAHADYQKALSQIKDINPNGTFEAITSVPCFEFWFILHFSCSRKSFSPQKGNSAGAQMLAELKKHIPNYDKKCQGIFHQLKDKLDTALNNCKISNAAAEKEGTDNPSTKVDYLVKNLFAVRDEFEERK